MFDVSNVLQLIERSLSSGRASQALELAEQAISQYRNEGRLYELAGLAYCKLGKTEKAISKFESATVLCPLSTISQVSLAVCYWRSGLEKPAITVANFLEQRFVSGHIDLAEGTRLVHCLEELGLFFAASKVCLKVYEEGMSNGHAAYGVAWYRALSGLEIFESIGWLETAVQLEPENACYRITLGYAFADSGNTAAAVKTFLEINENLVPQITCRFCLHEICEYLSENDSSDSGIVQAMHRQLSRLEVTRKGVPTLGDRYDI